jgi:hypothetical protein
MTIDWTTIEHDTEVLVSGAKGRFYFRGVNEDGSISVFGGTAQRAMYRAFLAQRCRPIQRRTKADPAWKEAGIGAAPARRGRR